MIINAQTDLNRQMRMPSMRINKVKMCQSKNRKTDVDVEIIELKMDILNYNQNFQDSTNLNCSDGKTEV